MSVSENYHKMLAESLIRRGYNVVLVSSVAVKRNRETLDGRVTPKPVCLKQQKRIHELWETAKHFNMSPTSPNTNRKRQLVISLNPTTIYSQFEFLYHLEKLFPF